MHLWGGKLYPTHPALEGSEYEEKDMPPVLDLSFYLKFMPF